MKHLFTLLIILLTLTSSYSQTRFSSVFTDHMVLQRNSTVSIWGQSTAGHEVTLKVSWNAKTYRTTTSSQSKWQIQVPTPKAGGPYQITLNDSIKLEDVLIGEVWVCSGQSNMEWSALAGIDNAEEAIQNATNDQIRFFNVPRTKATEPQLECDGTWSVCNSETMPSFSAVAYFFGMELQEKLNVPIGLIHSAWGGTAAETWTPKAIIDADAEFANWENTFEKRGDNPVAPAVLYNAMIHPLIPYEIAGVIWYQGESNVGNPLVYRRLFPAMISAWRKAWKKDFPFYYVQIAPFKYATPFSGALVQEAQLMALSTENAGMVVTNDIGNVNDIHPKNKLDVGKRLANWALNKTYKQDIVYSGPIYQAMEKEGASLRIHFDHAHGLILQTADPDAFLIAGADRVFYPASVTVEGRTLIAKHPQVKNPVALRYAFSNTAIGNLFNGAGLSASPFRTDDWPLLLADVNAQLKKGDKTITIELASEALATEIRYTLDGTRPGPDSKKYEAPILVTEDVLVRAVAVIDGKYSDVISQRKFVLNQATFAEVDFKSSYSERYQAGGENGLTDGSLGSLAFNDGNWQGFQGKDVVLTIDLGGQKKIKTIQTHFLQDQKSWIFLPTAVKVSVSRDNINFERVGQQTIPLAKDSDVKISTAAVDFALKEVRYIRIEATSIQKCPDWHSGSGGASWLFVDEVEVR